MPSVKRSVTHSIARTLFAIVLLSVFSSGLALLTLSGSLRDAEAINLAGSLRMQSYRLAWDITSRSSQQAEHISQYQQTLMAPALHSLDRFYVPDAVRQRYHDLLSSWQRLQPSLISDQTEINADRVTQIIHSVTQIDHFVLALQHWAELKMRIVALTCLLGFTAIALLVILTLRHIRLKIVGPLRQLLSASEAVEQTHFTLPPLSTDLDNELGVLARAFTRMSGELEKSWTAMSQTVRAKTESLTQANRRLTLLYACSQRLSRSVEGREAFQLTLALVRRHERLNSIAFSVPDFGELSAGHSDPQLPWHSIPLYLSHQPQPCGVLRWQAHSSEPRLMQGVASLLIHALELWQAQQQVQTLLLLEERATIARELHDSLAQSLTYLRIQIARLKRTLDPDAAQAQSVVAEFEQALVAANQQLRELLTTFRLTIEPASLARALEQVVLPLRQQSDARILLQCDSDGQLQAQQQIHVLQIVREALLNAIRHAHAEEITVSTRRGEQGELTLTVADDGVGIASQQEPPDHYGLTIMRERAARLNGTLSITRSETGGTCVSLHFMPVTETVFPAAVIAVPPSTRSGSEA
ncbi:nitrate/nitrite two-component system sensor histidine kinase NarQ [Erwinia sp. SLM-02]|uniref:nitrate/nitrite two-component system sensor histidine kinase NarQ n=1 Tax=Erwinia sp. SLM-02 TaxID=3020057 RepID=UPI00307FD7A8